MVRTYQVFVVSVNKSRFNIKSLYHFNYQCFLRSTTMSTMSTERGWSWEKAHLEWCTQAETSATRSDWPSKKYQRETAGENLPKHGRPCSLLPVALKLSRCCYRRRRTFVRTLALSLSCTACIAMSCYLQAQAFPIFCPISSEA